MQHTLGTSAPAMPGLFFSWRLKKHAHVVYGACREDFIGQMGLYDVAVRIPGILELRHPLGCGTLLPPRVVRRM